MKYALVTCTCVSALPMAERSVAYTRLNGSSGELLIARTTSLPLLAGRGKELRACSAAPFCFSHVARNSFWNSATTGPSIRRCVSRHCGLPSAWRLEDLLKEPAE